MPARGPAAARAAGAALFARFQRQLANLTAFTLLQAASYLIPVVTIPYFARVLTIAGMGRLAIAGAVALAAGVLMDYAIQLSGARFAAAHSEDLPAVNAYLNDTTALKLAIFLPIVLLLCAAAVLLDLAAADFWLFFWSLGSAATVCLFPQWLFQGLLAMPVAARILVSCRVAAAAAAMALVRSPADAFMVPMTQALAGTAALGLTVRVLKRRFGMTPGRAGRGRAAALARENRALFSATAWGAAYSHGAVIIMGALLPATGVGYYSIAQKISQAFVSMFNVAAQTAFPVLVRAHARAAESFGRGVGTYVAVVAAAAAAALAVMHLARGPIYGFFAGRDSELGVDVFSLWLAASLFTVVSVSLNPVMVTLRLDGRMALVYRFTGLTFLLCAPIACAQFGVLGMTWATLVTEGFMALFFIVSARDGLRRADRPKAGR